LQIEQIESVEINYECERNKLKVFFVNDTEIDLIKDFDDMDDVEIDELNYLKMIPSENSNFVMTNQLVLLTIILKQY
jgi:hypothetical protein